MHYTIYFNQKPLFLIESISEKIKNLLHQPSTVFQQDLNNRAVQSMLQAMQEENTKAGVFLAAEAEALLQLFKQNMHVIQAGGGLVHTDNNTLLLIYRNGKWDLPKGKVDKGETIAAAALREVQEETGLQELQSEEPLPVTYHTYIQNEKLILKESHWFLMKSTEQETLVPQQEEGIQICKWVKLDATASYLQNTHPSISDVIDVGIKKTNYKGKNLKCSCLAYGL